MNVSGTAGGMVNTVIKRARVDVLIGYSKNNRNVTTFWLFRAFTLYDGCIYDPLGHHLVNPTQCSTCNTNASES